MAIVRRSPELRAVLITWPIFNLAAAGINVAEVVLVKQVFHGGDVGFGVLVGSVGLGLVIGSFVSSQVIARIGLAATYSGSIALLGVGVGAAALSPDVWVASGFAVLFGIGNGAAVVCNFLLIARGAPDNLRGRAVVLLMSVGSSSLFLGMVVAGQFTDIVGARWVWGGAAIIALVAAFVGFRLVRRVPEKRGAELPEAPSIGTSPVAGLEETSRP
jgi:MFS family permease